MLLALRMEAKATSQGIPIAPTVLKRQGDRFGPMKFNLDFWLLIGK